MSGIQKIKNIDKETFECIYNTYFDSLCLHAQKKVMYKAIAEDVVHDFFANLWGNRENIHVDKSFKAYSYRGITNTCLKYLKHLEVERRYIENLSHITNARDDSYNPENILIENEKECMIKNATDILKMSIPYILSEYFSKYDANIKNYF